MDKESTEEAKILVTEVALLFYIVVTTKATNCMIVQRNCLNICQHFLRTKAEATESNVLVPHFSKTITDECNVQSLILVLQKALPMTEQYRYALFSYNTFM